MIIRKGKRIIFITSEEAARDAAKAGGFEIVVICLSHADEAPCVSVSISPQEFASIGGSNERTWKWEKQRENLVSSLVRELEGEDPQGCPLFGNGCGV